MKQCYVGESFVQRFSVSFDDDTGQRVESGEFEVYLNDTVVASGALSIDQTGRLLSFRFTPRQEGTMEIRLTWRVGDDVWRQPFLMKVVGL